MKVAFFFAVVAVVAVNGADIKGRTPLHEAAEKGETEKVKELLGKDAVVDAKDAEELTPLHLASSSGKLDVIKLLLEKGANANAEDKNGRRPAHWAASSGQLDVLKYFLSSTKASLIAVDDDGNQPETLAEKNGHKETAKFLGEVQKRNKVGARSMVGLM